MIVKLIRDDTRGSALVEFTVTFPFFLLLMFGLLQAGLLLYTNTGLQHGVERAARCASVNYSAKQIGLTQSCFAVAPTDVTDTTIKQYAAQSSWGLVPSSDSFIVHSPPDANANCGTDTNGNVVPGFVVTVSSTPNLLRYIFPSVTLNAKSCFPINIS
jgi:Flp pilus assembly protein TadG